MKRGKKPSGKEKEKTYLSFPLKCRAQHHTVVVCYRAVSIVSEDKLAYWQVSITRKPSYKDWINK